MINIPKGTKDILPGETYKWQMVEDLFRETCESFGFREIRTPLFEHTELFKRGVGETTDVVQKEMYTFEIAERSLTLKPEGTAPVVRSFIENKLYAEPLPAKYYYITPCYRYEKMQKGRQREFHQFGIEIFGSSDALADVEVISLGATFLKACGLDDVQLRINSIGCPECRGKYRQALQDFLRPHYDELCDTCKSRFDRNPMRILDCKSPICQEIAKDAPRMLDFLCDDCRKAFEDVKAGLTALGIEYTVDPNIVRGLDYYTRTAFEFISDKLGAQSTVCGGGRYDDLIEVVGGPSIPGVGFGLGIERLLIAMEASDIDMGAPEGCDVFVTYLGEKAKLEALKISRDLREEGYNVMMDVCGRGLKTQFKCADRSGAAFTVIVGDDELAKGTVTLRNMNDSTQREIPESDIISELEKEF